MLYDYVYRQCKVTYSDRKGISHCLGQRAGEEMERLGGDTEGLLGVGTTCYLDYDDGFTDVYVDLNLSKLYTLNICGLFYAKYSPIKLFQKIQC